jgi:hypothetical protein
VGLPRTNGVKKPIFDYDWSYTKYYFSKATSTVVGSYRVLRNDDYRNSQMVIVYSSTIFEKMAVG